MLCQSSSNQMQIISSLNMCPLPYLQHSPLGGITVIPGVHFYLIYKKPGDGCTYNDPSKVILRFSLSWAVIHPLAGTSKMFCSVSFWQLETTTPTSPFHTVTVLQRSLSSLLGFLLLLYLFIFPSWTPPLLENAGPKGKTRSLATPCT